MAIISGSLRFSPVLLESLALSYARITADIAAVANRLNLERLVVIAVVVVSGLLAAVNALKRARGFHPARANLFGTVPAEAALGIAIPLENDRAFETERDVYAAEVHSDVLFFLRCGLVGKRISAGEMPKTFANALARRIDMPLKPRSMWLTIPGDTSIRAANAVWLNPCRSRYSLIRSMVLMP